ncbi:MAG: S1 RNA-binding domain-containing protein [Bacillota bacterium]|nr:S1 RNA-binding domain-containing protein [Bacillota bacterium]
MQLEVGEILEGKVTGITKFGAFVSLPGGKTGLVHISEIANGFVENVSQYVQNGMTVKVKVLGINGDKINLSMKKAVEQPKARQSVEQPRREKRENSENQGFEDKLKKFMQESDSRIADNLMYSDRGKSRKRR